MGTHPIFESDFDCLTEFLMADTVVEVPINPAAGDVPSVKPAADYPVIEEISDDPKVEEISDDPKIEEIPEEPQIEEIDENAEDGAGDAQTEGKQSRAQKKVMKAMSKLNLKSPRYHESRHEKFKERKFAFFYSRWRSLQGTRFGYIHCFRRGGARGLPSKRPDESS